MASGTPLPGTDDGGPSTPDAVAATAQSRERGPETAPAGTAQADAREGQDFLIGAGIARQPVSPYQRSKGDPVYRPLRIYTVDPSTPKLDGAIETINVPYEPLEPGPCGRLFSVDHRDHEQQLDYRRADLSDQRVLIADGYDPSPSDPRFHQQMVYAVCMTTYAVFRSALGRTLSWGFGRPDEAVPLALIPHFGNARNAWYGNDGTSGAIRFGYYCADQRPSDRTLPGGYVFTGLSQDIIAHEVTHALLDGLRAHFALPSGPDVPAFHEAFADLVAIFQHFSLPGVLQVAMRRCRGALEEADLLTGLARQFGHTTGQQGPLRTAIERGPGQPITRYPRDATGMEPHALGSILVSAVFEAFVKVFKRKTERYVRLATGGSGVLPAGEIPHDLQRVLADKASRLASQFLTICVRAIDYSPPVGINFGDYLQALITADYDVAPSDPWDYRGALIDAFWQRAIYPRYATSLSEDALLWREPRRPLPAVPGLSFGELKFRGDPAQVASKDELRNQALALGRYLGARSDAEWADFGLVRRGDARLGGDAVGLPTIESIRTARRAGPDGQIVFDLVAEITQRRDVAARAGQAGFSYFGGCTVILGPTGEVRYLVSKSVVGENRLQRRRAFLESAPGARFWKVEDGRYERRGNMFALLHEPTA